MMHSRSDDKSDHRNRQTINGEEKQKFKLAERILSINTGMLIAAMFCYLLLEPLEAIRNIWNFAADAYIKILVGIVGYITLRKTSNDTGRTV